MEYHGHIVVGSTMDTGMVYSVSMDYQIHYIAGLIDGEGCIQLSRQRASAKFRSPNVSVASTTPELLNILKGRFGGSISTKKAYQDHHKQSWEWKVTHDNAIRVCREVAPVLLEPAKRARAEMIVSRYKSVTKRNGKYTEDERNKKLQFEHDFMAI